MTEPGIRLHFDGTQVSEIQGHAGAKLWAFEHAAGDLLADLCAQDADRSNLSVVPMDAKAWRAVQHLAGEVASRLEERAAQE